MNQFVLLICTVFFISVGNLKAQCTYHAVNATNDTLSFPVPCDFPLKANTGDSASDKNTYNADLALWNQNSPVISGLKLPNLSTPGITKIFFHISASEFEAFNSVRKDAIIANPTLYIIMH